MINSVDFKHLPIQDLVVSGLIIFIMSTIIANIYDPLLGITYAFGNILTLTFLSWLYKELGVIQRNKSNSKKINKKLLLYF